ncbi:barstar family protein [Deinococcus roseus]|uniref:barstar family protein n=1 Tax=Deinococcus roseus TaxID=392414 RepID=UPI00166EEB3C|nr:hypothetical protein [Deinococcus roseus]
MSHLEKTDQNWEWPTVVVDASIKQVWELFDRFGACVFDHQHQHLNPIMLDSSYFGAGFNGFLDCLVSLYDLHLEKITIVHHDFPVLEDEDMYIYFECLQDFCSAWREGNMKIEIVFQMDWREEVERILKKTELI